MVNAPRAWNFSDTSHLRYRRARAFYAGIFGWEATDLDFGGGGVATMWRRPGYGDHLAATVDPDIHRRQEGVAPPGFADAVAWLAPVTGGERPHWHVTFTVADRDEAVATALRLGAADLVGRSTACGRVPRWCARPQGASFTLSQFTPPT